MSLIFIPVTWHLSLNGQIGSNQDLYVGIQRFQLLHHQSFRTKAQRKVLPKASSTKTNDVTQTPVNGVAKIDGSGSVDEKAAAASVDMSTKRLDETATGASVKLSGRVDEK